MSTVVPSALAALLFIAMGILGIVFRESVFNGVVKNQRTYVGKRSARTVERTSSPFWIAAAGTFMVVLGVAALIAVIIRVIVGAG